jgi:hypothetical protein
MVGPSKSVLFPRGVADPDASHAYVRAAAGTVMALDLTSGEVLWRSAIGNLRPLSIVEDMLVTARITKPGALELVILESADGAVLRVSKPLPLPGWAHPSLDDTPEFTLRAEAEAQSAVIRWTARARYQGGAPPTAQVRESYEREAHGGARLDLETGTIELLDEEIDNAVALARQPGKSVAEADVLEQQEIGDKRFQLVAQAETDGTVKVLLRAVERNSGKVVWQSLLEEAPLRRPKPLRP